jgi:hypothetical protein
MFINPGSEMAWRQFCVLASGGVSEVHHSFVSPDSNSADFLNAIAVYMLSACASWGLRKMGIVRVTLTRCLFR